MSKNINVNPDHYKEAGRERRGKGILHDAERDESERIRRSGRRNDQPHIPNQERASTPKTAARPEKQAVSSDGAPRLTDDEGMVD